jgi:hypothetical protein
VGVSAGLPCQSLAIADRTFPAHPISVAVCCSPLAQVFPLETSPAIGHAAREQSRRSPSKCFSPTFAVMTRSLLPIFPYSVLVRIRLYIVVVVFKCQTCLLNCAEEEEVRVFDPCKRL